MNFKYLKFQYNFLGEKIKRIFHIQILHHE
jgi:hypothetical protein